MKSITFRPRGNDYVTYVIDGMYSDYGIKLSDLAYYGDVFKMLLNCNYFRIIIDGCRLYGYIDRYGNKILRYSSVVPERLSHLYSRRKRNAKSMAN